MDEKVLVQSYIVSRVGDSGTALAILQAKVAIASERTATATNRLAFATFALAGLTLVLVVVTALNGG